MIEQTMTRLSEDGMELVRHTDTMPVDRFQVLGERCSGTNYLRSLMTNTTPLSPSEILGWKHGFCTVQFVPRDFLPIVIFRNPLFWARSMFAKPWHRLEVRELGFSDWLREPFATTMDRNLWHENPLNHFGHSTELEGAARTALHAARMTARNRLGLGVQKSPDNVPDFAMGTPHQHDRHPMTGKAFETLLDLRNAKVESYLSYRNRECSYAFVQYEVIKQTPELFFEKLNEVFGIKVDDPLKLTSEWLGEMAHAREGDKSESEPSEADLAFMRERLDLKQEAELGYSL